MKKYFNTTGVCVPRKHYMVDIEDKLKDIESLINRENYFTINKPRQYGKTTTLALLKKRLTAKYIVVSCSFEGIGDVVFNDEKSFSQVFIQLMARSIELQNEECAHELMDMSNGAETIGDLSKVITRFLKSLSKEAILFIDEVDKSSNNQLFLSFLGMLRSKYLLRELEEDITFKSVILAGVHDVKSLKLKIRDDDEEKYNSPWNIAVNFNVDMSFNIEEIESMINEYCNKNCIKMDTREISQRLYYYTNGYPFLVSRLCQVVDEEIFKDEKTPWDSGAIDIAAKIILSEQNTLFESLIKNLENNTDLYDYIRQIIVAGEIKTFNIDNPLVKIGVDYGYFKNADGKVQVSNQIFLERIYNYMISKMENKASVMGKYNFKNNFITSDNGLDIVKILEKFMQYMKENYSSIDEKFIEREGRIIFLAFITPIINGTGFALKEVQVSDEKRLDIVITYNQFKYIIELKIWRGNSSYEKGINQLSEYLDIHTMNKGYMVIFNFNKSKEYKVDNVKVNNKEIVSAFI